MSFVDVVQEWLRERLEPDSHELGLPAGFDLAGRRMPDQGLGNTSAGPVMGFSSASWRTCIVLCATGSRKAGRRSVS